MIFKYFSQTTGHHINILITMKTLIRAKIKYFKPLQLLVKKKFSCLSFVLQAHGYRTQTQLFFNMVFGRLILFFLVCSCIQSFFVYYFFAIFSYFDLITFFVVKFDRSYARIPDHVTGSQVKLIGCLLGNLFGHEPVGILTLLIYF